MGPLMRSLVEKVKGHNFGIVLDPTELLPSRQQFSKMDDAATTAKTKPFTTQAQHHNTQHSAKQTSKPAELANKPILLEDHNKPAIADTYQADMSVFYNSQVDYDSFSSEQKIKAIVKQTKHQSKIIEAKLNDPSVNKGLLRKEQNPTSVIQLTHTEALQLANKWVGNNYKEIDSGVFRNIDGSKQAIVTGFNQFRMDNNSLLGNHKPNEPHIHLQTVTKDGKGFILNNHIIIRKD